MRDPIDRLKDQSRERRTPCPDRSNVTDICLQSSLPEGFSMEWVLDRYEQTTTHSGGQM